jgi:glycosyltransferase involved in cell wall biosynthesis
MGNSLSCAQNFSCLFYLEIVFFVAIGLQLVYFLLFLIAFSKEKKTSAHPAAGLPPVSVVVCAHDELENLQQLVPLLLAQEHHLFEVIVVNDRSNDATRDWLLTETQLHARLRMVHVEQTPPHINGKKYALTLGIRAAQHEWIALTDADCRPHSTQWLQQLMEQTDATTTFVLGYSPYQKKKGWLNAFIRFEALITAVQYLGFALVKIPYMGVGRNMAYRKSLFMQSKGFNELLSLTGGDDDLFVNRHAAAGNTRVALGGHALVTSIPKNTVTEFFQQKVRHLAAGKKYKAGHRLLLGLFMLSWWASWWLGIALLVFSAQPYVIAGFLLARVICVHITLPMVVKRLGDTLEMGGILLLDFLYTIYYLTTGTAALTTRKIKWKKN